MYIKEKHYGVKAFLVQLRDTETFEPMPGITLGDCGHKMGRNGLDNGWIQFSGVRIPRTNMLMKHTKVDKDGAVKQAKFEQINYGPLVHGRVAILASMISSVWNRKEKKRTVQFFPPSFLIKPAPSQQRRPSPLPSGMAR